MLYAPYLNETSWQSLTVWSHNGAYHALRDVSNNEWKWVFWEHSGKWILRLNQSVLPYFFPIPESLGCHSSQFPKGGQGTFSRRRATLEFQVGTTNPIHIGIPLSFQKRLYTFIEKIHRFISKSFVHVVSCKEAQNKVFQKRYQKIYTILKPA